MEPVDAAPQNRIEWTTEPLRLALTRDQLVFGARMPGCESAETAQDRWLTRELAPHLHFLGIVRSGCGLETGGGGGLAYTVEVKPNVYVVASIGMWLTPPIHEERDVRIDPVARLDLVFPRKDGRSFNVGLFASRTTMGLGFGFVF